MALARVARGCGVRTPGGAYLVTETGATGIPLEQLVVDPPVAIDAVPLGLAPQGMSLGVEPDGRTAVFDWVGAEHYPNAADFIEEVALFGSSRRVPTTFDFKRLQPGSRHILIHPRGTVRNPGWLLANVTNEVVTPSYLARAAKRTGHGWCPFNAEHEAWQAQPRRYCAVHHWEVLQPDTVRYDHDPELMEQQCQRDRPVARAMPAFGYAGFVLPDRDVWAPDWAPAVILTLPVTAVHVVRDPDDLTHEPALDRASKAGLPVELVDE